MRLLTIPAAALSASTLERLADELEEYRRDAIGYSWPDALKLAETAQKEIREENLHRARALIAESEEGDAP